MKYIITSLLLIVTLIFNAQLKVVNNALLEIEQNVYEKSFSKKWKKNKQKDWEAKCTEAKDVETLNTLFNEYSDLLAQSINFSMGNSDATTELEFASYLLRVEGTLSSDLTEKWNVEERTKWKSQLSSFVAEEAQKEKEEDLMRKFHIVTGIVKSFENNFPIVWADAKKNQFKSINLSAPIFKGGSDEVIKEDSYGVKSFSVFFDTEGDTQMAVKVLIEMQLIITSQLETGYNKTNKHDVEFNSNNKYIYQFEGEKFSETAKRPTITIGAQKDKPGVYLEITEPVFGH